MKALHILSVLAASAGISWGYELHEWGTFTTVSGSDGVLLPGLQREEEPLPPFVYSHLGMENGQQPSFAHAGKLRQQYGSLWPANDELRASKGFGKRPLAGVTVKMETPVIYFHSTDAFRAKVEVGFNGGSISQWYPARSGGETPPMPPVPEKVVAQQGPAAPWVIDFSKGYKGSISWDMDVLSPADSCRAITFKPGDTVNWMRARVPEANVLRTEKDTEGYLFYRGVGNFEPGLLTRVDATGKLQITNRTGAAIPYLLIFERRNSLTTWKEIPAGLAAGGELVLPAPEPSGTAPSFKANTDPANPNAPDIYSPLLSDLHTALTAGLAKTGLLESEARAMVETWWGSYFEKDGLRVFWILPQATTEKILPLKVEPVPEKIVRVLVGRSEILRPDQETRWLAMANKPKEKELWDNFTGYDRFGLAIKQRIENLRTEKAQTSGMER